MAHYLGTVLLLGIIISGVYLYLKVAKLNREIAEQCDKESPETGDGEK